MMKRTQKEKYKKDFLGRQFTFEFEEKKMKMYKKLIIESLIELNYDINKRSAS